VFLGKFPVETMEIGKKDGLKLMKISDFIENFLFLSQYL